MKTCGMDKSTTLNRSRMVSEAGAIVLASAEEACGNITPRFVFVVVTESRDVAAVVSLAFASLFLFLYNCSSLCLMFFDSSMLPFIGVSNCF